ncbi:N-glycosylase/DNA lyase [Candidatus Caldarchaeum subterraneum]|uniref:8-oxoguanine DNA glycosylase/AP lyase n=1 Tax=Caldiarchaeum subterraneum TaxID=311458 RepID=E6N8P4_CALS0|nr:N-glycosylase/DNA lyase [Candidatus Caldarchaeum subterraneum]BAJ51368.1 N-glycosylase/DNA lyase [Candidatus Caldarchaeum subterraneum]
MKTSAVLSKLPLYRDEIRVVVQQFRRNFFDDDRVLEELVYCLCTPQTKALCALTAVEKLFDKGALWQGEISRIESVLRNSGVRFHRTKARHIVDALKMFGDVLAVVRSGRSHVEIRRFLVDVVVGLGMKEASHFLRNIGFDGLAILDRHILRYMAANRIINKVDSPFSPWRYLDYERKFVSHAEKIGLTPAELDLLIWASATGRVLK